MTNTLVTVGSPAFLDLKIRDFLSLPHGRFSFVRLSGTGCYGRVEKLSMREITYKCFAQEFCLRMPSMQTIVINASAQRPAICPPPGSRASWRRSPHFFLTTRIASIRTATNSTNSVRRIRFKPKSASARKRISRRSTAESARFRFSTELGRAPTLAPTVGSPCWSPEKSDHPKRSPLGNVSATAT